MHTRKHKQKRSGLRRFLVGAFSKKVRIAKWQLNVFGVTCFLTGSIFGAYVILTKQFPAIFAAPVSTTYTVDTRTQFENGTAVGVNIGGEGSAAKLEIGDGYEDLVQADPSLVSFWKLDGNLTDSAGGNDFTLGNANVPLYGAGQFNNALDYTNDRTSLITNGNIPVSDYTDYTFELWINMPSYLGNYGPIINSQGNLFNLMTGYDSGAGTNSLLLSGYGGSRNVSDGAWHHVVVSVTGGSQADVYLDGVLEIQDASFGGQISSSGWCLAKNCGYQAQAFKGLIDDVAFYGRSLSAVEARSHYGARSFITGKTTWGFWQSSLGNDVIDLGYVADWGESVDPQAKALEVVADNVSNDEPITIELRSASTRADLENASWLEIVSPITQNGTTSFTVADLGGLPAARYVQLAIYLSNPLEDASLAEVDSATFFYQGDESAPETQPSSLAMQIYWTDPNTWQPAMIDPPSDGQNVWDNNPPYSSFTWNNAADQDAGVLGYCVYYGTDPTADPTQTSGFLFASTTDDPAAWQYFNNGLPEFLVDANTLKKPDGTNVCPFILKEGVDGQTVFSGSDVNNNLGFRDYPNTSAQPYYFKLKAIDKAGNTAANSLTYTFKVDSSGPNAAKFVSAPSGFVSDKAVTVTWPIGGVDVANDIDGSWENGEWQAEREISGIAGYQYKIADDRTDSSIPWYGLKHTGSQYMDDLIPADAGTYTLQGEFRDDNGNLITDNDGNPLSDFAYLREGVNYFWLRACDHAGNCTDDEKMKAIIKLNTVAPSAPRSLAVTPGNSIDNAYAFSWQKPETFQGLEGNIQYCYSINALPSASTCLYTPAGVTSLPADAFANQPGENTFYLAARDEAGNINYAVYESVNFTYSGSAPGMVRNPDIADISIKTANSWKLAVSWEEPENVGAGVDSYKLFRSTTKATCATNPSAFEQIGSTSGTSFVDSGLMQKDYYYCLKACDSANSCGAYSATVQAYPNGKFTESAEIIGAPKAVDISTRRATITWTTERDSDSKVAFGENPDGYGKEEPSISKQTEEHEITLTNLEPGKTYYYRAKWTDEDGNTGESKEQSFKTETAPSVKHVEIKNVGLESALAAFTVKGASKAKIYYGTNTSFGAAKEISTAKNEAKYTLELPELSDDTKYYYKINTFDTEGAEYEGTTLDFTTLPRPRITEVHVQQMPRSAQPTILVSWQTNTETSSIVTYWTNDGQRSNEVAADQIAGEHKIIIKSLFAETVYRMVVRGRDKMGNEAVSDEYTFTTASDTRPPQISDLNVDSANVRVSSDGNSTSQLIVSWNTDEPATSQVEFGEGSGGAYSQKTQDDQNLTMNHLVVISGLTPSKVYHLRAVSNDKADNQTNSIDTVTITPKAVDNALDLVVSNLQEIFGFLGGLGK